MKIHDLFRLDESVATQNAIETIATSFISNLATKNIEEYRGYAGYTPIHQMANIRMAALTNMKIKVSRFPILVKKFVQEMGMLSVSFKSERGGTKGEYWPDFNSINLFVNYEFETQVNSTLLHNDFPYFSLVNLFKFRMDTLVHELTHAFQNWVSKGKWKDNTRSRDALAARQTHHNWPESPEIFAQYRNDPIEINARYSQVIQRIRVNFSNTDWPNVGRMFKWEIGDWSQIPKIEQRRLVLRLYAEWSAEQRPKTRDMKTEFETFYEKLRETTGLWIYMSLRSSTVISIDTFGTDDNDKIFDIIKQVIKFADIRKLTVAIESLPISPALRALGFIPNRGSRQRYDLRVGTKVYRDGRKDAVFPKK